MSQIKRFALVLSLIVLISLPALSFSSKRHDLYVDDSNKGKEDGSKSHPYSTINEAMDKAKSKTDIHVAKGTYKENIEIEDGVRIFGEDKEKVTIEAKNDNKPVIFMNDDTVIDKVTITGGKYGIKVQDDAEVSIVKCLVEDSDNEGIRVNPGKVKDSRKVSISKTTVKNNDGAGIYSGKRKIVIMDSNIHNNRGDGIFVANGSDAYIAGNDISNNKKSGMVLKVDSSNIWTKNNTVKRNGREGVEVEFNGGAGRVDITKSSIANNGRFGVSRVQKYVFGNNFGLWRKYLTFGESNNIFGNKSGDISNIFIVK